MKRNRKRRADAGTDFRPFSDLPDRLRRRSISLPLCAVPLPPDPEAAPPDPEAEERLFSEAMADVTPLPRESEIPTAAPVEPPAPEEPSAGDAEPLRRLRELVECGCGFVVSDTPEYMEGRGPRVSTEVVRRLHRGDFSIQDHVDLHGLTALEARDAVERFLGRSLRERKRALLIVHGRGLSSPVEPVLKKNVRHWLTRGPWRKWVMAFASARACDGGAGATYVLLRSRPASRRDRKGKGEAPRRGEEGEPSPPNADSIREPGGEPPRPAGSASTRAARQRGKRSSSQ
jgi:DNA-nicking Smr family endonuclease